MAAYVIVRVKITDPEKYQQYLAVAPDVIRKYGGEYVVRAGKTVTLEGPSEARRIIVIQFPTLEKAQEFYNSPEYVEARKLRKDAAEGELIAVEGVSSGTDIF